MSRGNPEFFGLTQTHNQIDSYLPPADPGEDPPGGSQLDVTTTRLRTESPMSTLLFAFMYFTCSFFEPDDSRQKILFQAICNELSQQKYLNVSASLLSRLLIDKPGIGESIGLFIKHIHAKIRNQMPTLNNGPNNRLACRVSSLSSQTSRYEDSFEEESVIAQGGFGVVCKALHKVDGVIYAVKKIFFTAKNSDDIEKTTREAKSIALLQHRNIVHYNNAWLENADESQAVLSDSESGDDSEKQGSTDESQSCSKTSWDVSFRNDETQSCEINNNLSSSSTSTCTVYEYHTSYLSSAKSAQTLMPNDRNGVVEPPVKGQRQRHSSGATCSSSDYKDNEHPKKNSHHITNQILVPNTNVSPFLHIKATLYIQMEYCDCDLRTWMDDMMINGKVVGKNMNPINIFRQILCGVEHIHSKSLIHRDLKPKNIFISEETGTVKIGDFGLACLVSQAHTDNRTDEQSYNSAPPQTANLGTPPYMAPEQENGDRYDNKVDIYSSGIILLELLTPCCTRMEFFENVKEMLDGHFPKHITADQRELIQAMVQKNCAERPSSSDILTIPIFANQSLKKKMDALKNQTKRLNNMTTRQEEYIVALSGIQDTNLMKCLLENETLKKINQSYKEEIKKLKWKISMLENCE